MNERVSVSTVPVLCIDCTAAVVEPKQWHGAGPLCLRCLGKRGAHCWKDRGEDAEERFGVGSPEYVDAVFEPATCMLAAGHDGPHEFTSDSEIGVTFSGSENNGD